MKQITLIIGGCKSGKSRYALQSANQQEGAKKIFIATSVPFDEEMKQRIHRHQMERGNDWITLEAPEHLTDALKANATSGRVIVADCLTLWMNNLLMKTTDPKILSGRISDLIESLEGLDCPVYLVSNEVGTGIVPENKLARLFRDMAGSLNQEVATKADQVVWMVAGIAVKIK